MDPSFDLRRRLSETSNLPLDRPFARAEAISRGVSGRRLAHWVTSGQLIHPLEGIYHAAQLPDGLQLRLDCLRLVLPRDAVITDRTAAWLLGAPMALAPGDHLVVPRVSTFRRPGYRLRNQLTASGERRFAGDDILFIDDFRVTTPLRTACDLGRLLHRDQALAAIDALMRIGGFDVPALLGYAERYKGYRGVRQLRGLAPLADPRSQSPGESILRLRWLDCGTLPEPTPQLEVPGPDGRSYFLDLGVEGLPYAAEYDGAEWHGPDRREHDAARREWIGTELGYEIDVFTAANIHGAQQDAHVRLKQGVARALSRTS